MVRGNVLGLGEGEALHFYVYLCLSIVFSIVNLSHFMIFSVRFLFGGDITEKNDFFLFCFCHFSTRQTEKEKKSSFFFPTYDMMPVSWWKCLGGRVYRRTTVS